MRYFLISILLIVATHVFSQGINAYVVDINEEPIPYASISILNTNKGSFSNEKGKFNLEYRLNKNDTLAISCIGYKSIKIPFGSADFTNKIVLEKDIRQIKPVIIAAHKQKLHTVKDNKRVSISACLSKGMELVTFINIPKGGTLSDVTFYCQRTASPRLLGVRVYNVGIDGKPKDCIISENRVVKIGSFHNKFKFDMKDLNIIAEQNGIFVGVQYIYINTGDLKKSKNQNPYLYFSTMNSINRSYIRSIIDLDFIKCKLGEKSEITNKPINLQCSYSYYCHSKQTLKTSAY